MSLRDELCGGCHRSGCDTHWANLPFHSSCAQRMAADEMTRLSGLKKASLQEAGR